MSLYIAKRLFYRCILAFIVIFIILTWTNNIEWLWYLGTRPFTKINEYHADTFKPRNLRHEDKELITCNTSKIGVPCHTPPYTIDLCIPHPPITKDAFNGTAQSSYITIVTGYFNLGTFQKGDSQFSTEDMFKGWMKRLSKIHNYMLVFVDDNTTDVIIRTVRSSLPSYLTKIIHIKRSELWAFKLENTIKKIYSVPCYPKFHPNTVRPSYSCVMHAKYDLLRIAVQENHFSTKYFSWLDIGYFRDEPEDGPPFSLGLPEHFDEEKVAYTEIYPREPLKNCKEIVFGNSVWVGGGYFVGRGDVIVTLVTQYQTHVYNMLQSGLMSTDQQVLYCMLNAQPHPASVKIQGYKAQREHHDWFTLGYLSRKRDA